MIKTPAFWYDNNGLFNKFKAIALTPISWLYALAHFVNFNLKTPKKAPISVICIGNIVMGGSGKTPTTLALIDLIKNYGFAQNPMILTRGYGGKANAPTMVNLDRHTHEDAGDEALLMAAHAPVIVSANRYQGAMLAHANGADLIIMDDGFQNNTLHKDISLLVVDGLNPLGNGARFPAGPLRESVRGALKRCDATISLNVETTLDARNYNAQITADDSGIDKMQNLIAFAGLGRPEKFKQTLLDMGLNLVNFQSFADHHPYSDAELNALIAQAKAKSAGLITTEKDYMRLPDAFKKQIQYLPITLSFENPDALMALITEKLGAK